MILITGASSGIGEACAWRFAKDKRSLFLVARRLDRLKKLAAELKEKCGVEVHVAKLDVSSKTQVAAWAKENASLLSKVEVLVNNAGLAKGAEGLQKGDPSDWDVMIDTNIKGLLYVTHAVLPHLLERNTGHVIHLGSVAGRWAYANGNVYCATKSAVAMLTETMRIDLLGTGIRVTNICPGMANTEFSLVRFGTQEKADAVYKGMKPLTASDIADTVFWAHSRPPHVNIQEIVIYATAQANPSTVSRKGS